MTSTPTTDASLASIETRFGAAVRKLRKSRGWTQEELAYRLSYGGNDMHQTTLCKLESGSRPTTLRDAEVLALVFGVSVADLLAGSPDDFARAAYTSAARDAFVPATRDSDSLASIADSLRELANVSARDLREERLRSGLLRAQVDELREQLTDAQLGISAPWVGPPTPLLGYVIVRDVPIRDLVEARRRLAFLGPDYRVAEVRELPEADR
jgi:transcriptional regulator with XRE-family HTH domain